jgi:hypothetical protein
MDKSAFSNHVAEQGAEPDGEELVFVCNRHFVECPEKIIPSFIRLVRVKKRVNSLGNVPASSLNAVLEVDGTACEREGGVPRVDLSSGDGQRVAEIVRARLGV